MKPILVFMYIYIYVKVRTLAHTIVRVGQSVKRKTGDAGEKKKKTHFNEKKVKRLLKVCKCTKAPNKYCEREKWL